MSSSAAWPDLWELAARGPDPAAARAMLLKLQADLFVSAPARDTETVRSFEMIALGLLPRVDHAVIAAVADVIVPLAETPASVIDAIAQRSHELQEIVMSASPRLSPALIDLALASARGRIALARRGDLDGRSLQRLLLLGDEALDIALAHNPAIGLDDDALRILIARARRSPPLAAALLAREDLPAADEAALYLLAESDRRARIRESVAASALFHRPRLAFRLTGARVEELLRDLARGDVRALEAQLTACFGLPENVEWRLLEKGRPELFALALKALGVAEEDATRLFLTLHPAISHSVEAVFGLVRSFRAVDRPAALALVEAILGEPTAFARPRRSQPTTLAAGPPAERSQRNVERSWSGGDAEQQVQSVSAARSRK